VLRQFAIGCAHKGAQLERDVHILVVYLRYVIAAPALDWARAHRNWRRRDRNTVLFSDESRFNLSLADGRVRVYHRKGERFAPVFVRRHDRFGGGVLRFWAG